MLARDPGTGALQATGWTTPLPAAAYLASHPSGSHLYAASETAEGRIVALRPRPLGPPVPSSECGSGGAGPCYLAVHPSGRLAAAANYHSGGLGLLWIGPDGELAGLADVVDGFGSGPDLDRQSMPHPHCAVFPPSGRHLIVADLGADTITSYAVDAGNGKLTVITRVAVPPGTGPRHVVVAGGTLYATGELNTSVLALPFDAASGQIGPPAVAGASQAADTSRNLTSDVALSPSGKHCYVANRGLDTVTTLARHGHRLVPTAEVPAGGRWPVLLLPTGGHLYVANQHSDAITCFSLARPGRPALLPGALTLARPSSLLALPPGVPMTG